MRAPRGQFCLDPVRGRLSYCGNFSDRGGISLWPRYRTQVTVGARRIVSLLLQHSASSMASIAIEPWRIE
jgi:hypothetical protein